VSKLIIELQLITIQVGNKKNCDLHFSLRNACSGASGKGQIGQKVIAISLALQGLHVIMRSEG
jgi:uncharacterized metal-binding protein